MWSVVSVGLIFLSLSTVGAQYDDYCQAPLPTQSVDTDGKTLRFVQVLTRHGDRTPTQLVPGDNGDWICHLTSLDFPNLNSLAEILPLPRLYRKVYMSGREQLPGNCSMGQLTQKGLVQHQALGSQFLSIYGSSGYNVLPDVYDPSLVYVRSTDVPRTVASAQAHMSALFPAPDLANAIALLDINTMDNAIETMDSTTRNCPRLDLLLQSVQNGTAWKQETAQLAPLYAKLQQLFNTTNVPAWGPLFDNMGARFCHGMPLPAGVTPEMLAEIKAASDFFDNQLYSNATINKYFMGLFIPELLAAFDNAIAGTSTLRYLYYSGHDSTVGPLAATFGVFNNVWPPYASHLEFEVWQGNQDQQYYVQVKYNGNSTVLPTCPGVMCPYKVFRMFAETRAITDWASECAL
eukprot:TRINITY_DN2744_c0_g1_i1.p1 TRINITY_DN2744_c0_g1~~TRINITY_DN2744_c0_g1_i1.p1  ORF type:complete len:420 (-),score=127.77 TRINITY_DN2744_c0_g1_i1:484-1698(-)